MSKLIKYCFAIVCVVGMALGTMSIFAHADSEEKAVIISYTEIPLYISGEYIGSGMKLDDITYVPLLAFCEAMLQSECEVTWDQETGLVTIETEELNLSLKITDNYMIANERYLYLPNGVYNINGTIIAPIREVVRIFGLDLEWDDENWVITIDDASYEIIENGEAFYDEHALYWLSRVISSEAGNQPLEGMMGVGNVVLNRVASPEFAASTVESVIFAPGQFAVVDTGAINMTPRDKAIIAAKLCLEGYSTVGDALFFHNPAISTTKWFEQNKTYCATIEDHEFFA